MVFVSSWEILIYDLGRYDVPFLQIIQQDLETKLLQNELKNAFLETRVLEKLSDALCLSQCSIITLPSG